MQKKPSNQQPISHQKGVVIVEYVLLLVIVVGLASTMINTMISRDPSDRGFIIQQWHGTLEAIGADFADGSNP